jgi:4-hydroxybenzoate polyprenyltransferase
MRALLKPPQTISATISLTRWREHVPFVIPLTILGSILGAHTAGRVFDMRIILVMMANILAVAYAFMINDIEDAEDDARDPSRAHKNVVSSGGLEVSKAYFACLVVAAFALLLYSAGGFLVIILGIVTLLLSHFYSSPPIRLKAWPVTDIVSHSLMLSTLLFLAGFYTYSQTPGASWWIITAATCVSAYGQLYNQLRDFVADKKAGLKNTAILLGKRKAKLLMYCAVTIALFCIIGAVVSGLFPLWLIITISIIIPMSKYWQKGEDLRGGELFESSGQYQNQAVVVFNIFVLLWFAQILTSQYMY